MRLKWRKYFLVKKILGLSIPHIFGDQHRNQTYNLLIKSYSESVYPIYIVSSVYTVTDLGVKMSIKSIISLVSTQVGHGCNICILEKRFGANYLLKSLIFPLFRSVRKSSNPKSAALSIELRVIAFQLSGLVPVFPGIG